MGRSLGVAVTFVLILSAACAPAWAQAPLTPAESRLGARLVDSATLKGVVIQQIVPDQAADRANLRVSDLVLRFQGAPIKDLASFSSFILMAPAGQRLSVEILRGAQVKFLVVVLPPAAAAPRVSAAPAAPAAQPAPARAGELKALEMRINALENQLAGLKAKRQAMLAGPARPAAPAPAPAPTTIVGDDGQTMVFIPAGEFIMGEVEAKRIYLDAFYIDQYEVTNAMWDRVAVSKRRPKSLCDRCPVITVSWYEANAYCTKVGKRLPTEAEWEKVARSPNGLAYVWGDQFRPGLANVKSDSDKFQFTVPIGSFSFDKSPYGVFDLAGNVSEWTATWYKSGYYATMPRSNPRGPDMGEFKIFRGGSWQSRESKTRTTTSDWSFPEEKYETVGFRCARSAR